MRTSPPISAREGLAMALGSVLIRVALIAAAIHGAGITLAQHALLHDGWEYLRLAQAFASLDTEGLDPETLRLFPGFPLGIALLGLGGIPVFAGLSIAIGCAAAVPWLTSVLGRDRILGWWLLALTPSWLVYTATVMSEGLSVLLCLCALLLAVRGRWGWGGLLGGLATLVRPVGALLLPVVAIEAWRRDGARGAAVALGAGLPLPVLHLVVSHLLWGDALQALRSYGDRDFAWPLLSFVQGTVGESVDVAQKTLIWLVLAVSVAGAWGLWRRVRVDETALRPLLLWHVAALAFYLLIPSEWSFRAFDRFALSIWPTAIIGLAPLIPRRRAVAVPLWLGLTAVSFHVALRWLVNLCAVFPFAERALPL